MKKPTMPSLKQGGTDEDKLPEWALTALRDDPDLLRDVAAIVRERSPRSPGRRL